MEVFGAAWKDHPQLMARRWQETVGDDDIVLVAGDISWAMHLDQAVPDLEFLAGMPGRKVLIKGNHDYWWSSVSKVRAALPAGVQVIQNDAVSINGVAVAGGRLWEDPEIAWGELLPDRDPAPPAPDPVRTEKLFQRELHRLRLSLAALDPEARVKIAMLHYPPTAPDLAATRAVRLLEEAAVDHCVFGHLHDLEPAGTAGAYGLRKGVAYHLTSCDYLGFTPLEVCRL